MSHALCSDHLKVDKENDLTVTETPCVHEVISDAYASEPKLRDLPLRFSTLARWPLLLMIRGYQKTLSKLLPQNTCRFYPSCSHYMYQAVYKYGAVKGFLMGIWRLLRCNPFSHGGYDPVP